MSSAATLTCCWIALPPPARRSSPGTPTEFVSFRSAARLVEATAERPRLPRLRPATVPLAGPGRPRSDRGDRPERADGRATGSRPWPATSTSTRRRSGCERGRDHRPGRRPRSSRYEITEPGMPQLASELRAEHGQLRPRSSACWPVPMLISAWSRSCTSRSGPTPPTPQALGLPGPLRPVPLRLPSARPTWRAARDRQRGPGDPSDRDPLPGDASTSRRRPASRSRSRRCAGACSPWATARPRRSRSSWRCTHGRCSDVWRRRASAART